MLHAGAPAQVRRIDPGEAEPLDRLVAEFRAALASGGAAADRAGKALRSAVFDRLTEALGGRKRLVLAPDGALAHVPFEALPADGGRLLDQYTISYVGAGRDVLRFGGAPLGAPSEAVVVADVDYGPGGAPAEPAAPSGGVLSRWFGKLWRAPQPTPLSLPESAAAPEPGTPQFARLPETRREGKAVAALWQAQLWTGDAGAAARLPRAACAAPGDARLLPERAAGRA